MNFQSAKLRKFENKKKNETTRFLLFYFQFGFFCIFAEKNMYLTPHISHIKKLCEQHKVERLYAFGSVVTDRFSEDSDVDLLVGFRDMPVENYADNYFDLKFSLQDIFNRQVDLLEDQAIKNPYFRRSIDNSKQLIYG